jgi:hypothetical protein
MTDARVAAMTGSRCSSRSSSNSSPVSAPRLIGRVQRQQKRPDQRQMWCEIDAIAPADPAHSRGLDHAGDQSDQRHAEAEQNQQRIAGQRATIRPRE